MIDMGQCDSTPPRSFSRKQQIAMSWRSALQVAAKSLGFKHWMLVPDSMSAELTNKAHAIRGN